jgi:probable F420-dependent oxidoreductase
MPPQLSVVLPYWFDRPQEEALDIARSAEACGYSRLWLGEMATFDAFAIGGAVAATTERIELVVGPLAAGVRSPVALALGVSSLERIGKRPAYLALGASSPEIVTGWHGAEWAPRVGRLRETWEATESLLRGEKIDYSGQFVESHRFRLQRPLAESEVAVAAFGPRMLEFAATHASRVVFNLLTPEAVAELIGRLVTLASAAGRERPAVTLWQTVALEPDAATLEQLASQVTAYLAPPGYGEMFSDAGLGELVARARAGEARSALARDLDREALARFVALGSLSEIGERLRHLEALGVDELALVPATANDPGAERTLRALAPAPAGS